MALDRYQLDFLNAAVVLPPELLAYAAIQPSILKRLGPGVGRAVEASFEHPDTAMRVITQSELKLRAQLAVDIVEMLYQEHLVTFSQILDELPGLLVEVLRAASEDGGLQTARTWAEQSMDPGRWTAPVPEGEPVGRVATDGEDLAAGAAASDNQQWTEEDEAGADTGT